ncbi:Ribulose-5-phosphate 4-epimerase/Fuculose-1-phosphate aldolase [Rhizobiales bacterium GAS188]|nr:Ribulose-5-phosphate 4-epimerase/Fuculose-1-phosphate aldolase [Rhizobiales bacterium GAS188]
MNIVEKPSSIASAEWQRRVELAACYRLIAHYRMADLIYTHSTVGIPGEPGHFLINPYGWRFDEITASSLVKIDVKGEKVGHSPHPVNPAGFTIHSAVHLSRHDAACVIHTHTKAGMAVAALKEGLLPLNQIALQFYGRLAIHGYDGIALDLDERERIVADLGEKHAMLLRNHGLLTVGGSVAEAFQLMYYLNLACEVQIAAQSTGAALVLPPREVCEKVAAQYDQQNFQDGELDLEWAAHLRLLNRLDPSYRD